MKRGFTLLELLIAVALLGLIAALVYPIVAGQQRLYRTETQRVDVRQNLRAAAAILTADLRELDATDGDILAMSETGITLRGTRQLAILCAIPAAASTPLLAVRDWPLFATRDFNPESDSLLIYYQDPAGQDAWLPARLVATGRGACADGAPARTLTARLASGVTFVLGAPIRGFEVVSYRLYKGGDGQWQIGMEDGGPGSIQPLVGPVTSHGLALIYRDRAGAITAIPDSVAAIDLQIRMPGDSTITAVALRNNRSF